MEFPKRYPILTSLLAFCVAAFLAEAVFIWLFSTQGKKEVAATQAAQAQLNAASAAAVQPTPENVEQAKKNVAELQDGLDRVMSDLKSTTPIPPAPTQGYDLIAQITGYVDTLTRLAKSKGILVPPGFTFGMGEYTGGKSPPPADKLTAVYKQKFVLDYILKQLFNNAKEPKQPMMILAAAREDVAATATAAPTTAGSDVVENSDIFTVSPLVTARQANAIDTLAFQIKFIGYTEALRLFLTSLANFDLPLVVRNIEVGDPKEAATTFAATETAIKTADSAAVGSSRTAAPPAPPPDTASVGPGGEAIVKDNMSEFTIVIEYIELVQANAADTPNSNPPKSEATPATGTAAAKP